MNMEIFLSIAGAFGGLEALKWLANVRSSRRKAASEAAGSVEEVVAKRTQCLEDSILFLQNQLRDKEKQFAELSTRHQEALERQLKLTHSLGEMKLKYRSTRCDHKECTNRKPPFQWMKKTVDKGAAMIALAILAMSAAACSKKVYVPVESVRIVADSTATVSLRCDTVIARDSVFLYIHGDSIVKESWRIRERITLLRDTVYESRRDTVVRPCIVEVEKKAPPLQRLKNGFASLIVFIAILSLPIIWRRIIHKE